MSSIFESPDLAPEEVAARLLVTPSALDDLTLADCGVVTGSTLKLVLSMRGGPINTRRVVMPSPPKQSQPPPNHAELHNLMMRNKAQILDKIPKNGQVSFMT